MDDEDTKRGNDNDEPTRERPEAPDEDRGTPFPIADQPPKKGDDGPEQGIAELPPEPPPHGIAEPGPPPPDPIAEPPPKRDGPSDAHDRDDK